jgi:hypothetical protein
MLPLQSVIAGLGPAIQPACEGRCIHAAFLDRRVKPGNDSLGVGMANGITPMANPGVNRTAMARAAG